MMAADDSPFHNSVIRDERRHILIVVLFVGGVDARLVFETKICVYTTETFSVKPTRLRHALPDVQRAEQDVVCLEITFTSLRI